SLPTGLLQAGVAGVVASLWSVADISTAMLMARFYDLWRKEKLPPAEALRQAQIWLRDASDRDKRAHFKDHLPEFAALRMPADAARTFLNWLNIQGQETESSFSHPFWWAAFAYTGA
ncbi:MAG TPA: CHAT domain-containing protein, partial [Anaerolineae bacterium]|nr:CHAT domain-containing protein [Anaerolineae bacterium]